MQRFRDPRVPSEPAGQRPHFDLGEGEVLVGDLDHVAGGLSPREGNGRCLAPGQNEVGRRRQRSRDFAEERRPRRARRDRVHVVKQQAHLQWRLPDQCADDFPRSRGNPTAGFAGSSVGGHGVEERRGEADGIFVCRFAAQPHVNPAWRGLVSPYRLGQNGRLAEARPATSNVTGRSQRPSSSRTSRRRGISTSRARGRPNGRASSATAGEGSPAVRRPGPMRSSAGPEAFIAFMPYGAEPPTS